MKLETSDLAGPVPLRKVDPKYPPELRTMHVDGEVVLYAIIRKDGSVDSIQLVHSVDPRLDANAMEALAQWKFGPAKNTASRSISKPWCTFRFVRAGRRFEVSGTGFSLCSV